MIFEWFYHKMNALFNGFSKLWIYIFLYKKFAIKFKIYSTGKYINMFYIANFLGPLDIGVHEMHVSK